MKRSFITLSKHKLRTRLNAFGAWLAILGILAQVIMPIGSALASTSDVAIEHIVICTSNGLRTVSLNADGAPVETDNRVSCPFCILHATAIPAEHDFEASEVFYSSAVSTVIWSPVFQTPATIWSAKTGPSRAPPSFV